MVERLEVPHPDEAHAVTYVVDGDAAGDWPPR
jgi:hypothetical protein